MRQAKRSYKTRPAHVLAATRKEVATRFKEAKVFFAQGKLELARRRVKQARRAAMKVQLRIPEHWNKYCRQCNSYLQQGRNSTIRLKKGIRIIRCQECGYVRRKIIKK